MPRNWFTNSQSIVNGMRYHALAQMFMPWDFTAGYINTKLGIDVLADQLSYQMPKYYTKYRKTEATSAVTCFAVS